MRAPTEAPRQLRQNRERYTELVQVVEAHAWRGDIERVLRSATMAANLGWRTPTGLLSDPRLEQLVIGAVRGVGEPPRLDTGRTSGRVLHVLTEGYQLGGHTRLAWHWMERDTRRSDVALTNQSGSAPDALHRAAAATGGRVHDLRASSTTLTDRVQSLRTLMDEADVVVAHVHPYDAILLAAASLPGPRPPIIYENHADHAYWLGLGCADVVMDHRSAAQQLTVELRGVLPHRSGVLPLPIDAFQPAADREAVRKALGLRPRDVASISVATPTKMLPLWGQGFEQVLARALTAHPRLKVFLVGPTADEPWRKPAARFQGRLLPLGPRGDLDVLFPAMDLYLDSYPISSGTSILEAAAAGLAPLSLLEHDGHRRIYHANSPGLEGTGHVTETLSSYLSQLGVLVGDRDERARRAELARSSVLAVHSGDAWSRSMEDLYQRARNVPAADLNEYPVAAEDLSYGAYLTPFMQGSSPAPALAAHAHPLGALFDDGLRNDLVAVTGRALGPKLSVRVRPGWADQPDWTSRLLVLAKDHPHLSVSLPFLDGDDPQATVSVQRLTALLTAVGDTSSSCGDISLDATEPARRPPFVSEQLDFLPDVLDRLELLLSSPCWDAPRTFTELATAGAR